MPVYHFKCRNCGAGQTLSLSIKDRKNAPVCCEKQMYKDLNYQSNIACGEFLGYTSTITGEYIDSIAAHEAHKKQHNLVEIKDNNDHYSKFGGRDPDRYRKTAAEFKMIYRDILKRMHSGKV